MTSESGSRSYQTSDTFKAGLLVNLPFVADSLRKKTSKAGVLNAISELTNEMNVNLSVEGDTSSWSQKDQGILFVGDHTNLWDGIFLLATLNNLGRQDILLTTKPHSRVNHALAALGDGEDIYTAPFFPKSMTQDGKPETFFDHVIRRRFRDALPTKQEAKQINEQTLALSATRLENGHIVNIFPAGKVSKQPATWQKGIGNIIKRLSPTAIDETLVVSYAFDNGHSKRTLLALYLSTYEINPIQQHITMRVKKQQRIGDIFSENVAELSVTEVTKLLQERM